LGTKWLGRYRDDAKLPQLHRGTLCGGDPTGRGEYAHQIRLNNPYADHDHHMTTKLANAYPRKNFFVQMFTKDISLEDCVLDLIDNSVDGFIRNRNLRLSSIASAIWEKNAPKKGGPGNLPLIRVSLSEAGFQISDNCGGIDLDEALSEVFKFGHPIGWQTESLGVYGIGLKRALFKLGDYFEISSRTRKNGFNCALRVSDWVRKDDSLDDWNIPITEQKPATSPGAAGTKIAVTELHDEVKERIKSGTVDASLRRAISTTFCFFLERYVRITVNDQKVEPLPIPTSKPSRGSISFDRFLDDGVDVRILATIAAEDEPGRYDGTRAGWYVICNGRAVLSADKGEITGWGTAPMPLFHPRHRAFVGVVFFESKNPMALPWTTTKRSLNRESSIYLRTRNRMALAAKPVLAFIGRQPLGDSDTASTQPSAARTGVIASPAELASSKPSIFQVPAWIPQPKVTQQVQYPAKIADLERVRRHLRQPRMAANKIGEHTFQYFLKEEGLT
jgi:hypothetical protein